MKKPTIRILGEHGMEEIDYDSIPEPVPVAYHLADYFKTVKISPKAIDMASRIIPDKYIKEHGGVHSYLSKFANQVFEKMPASARSASCGSLKFIYDFDKDGPVLKDVGFV